MTNFRPGQCRGCGAAFLPGATICPRCGARVGDVDEADRPLAWQAPPERGLRIPVPLVVCLVLALWAGAIWFMSTRNASAYHSNAELMGGLATDEEDAADEVVPALLILLAAAAWRAVTLWCGLKILHEHGDFVDLLLIATVITPFTAIPYMGSVIAAVLMFWLLVRWTSAEFWPDAVLIAVIANAIDRFIILAVLALRI